MAIRIDFLKLRSKDGRPLLGDCEFVFCTTKTFLVISVHRLADRVRQVGRNPLDLLPPQPLDYGMWEARRSCRPAYLLFGRAISSEETHSRSHFELDCLNPLHFRLAPWNFPVAPLIFSHLETPLWFAHAHGKQKQKERSELRDDWCSRA